jgi:hypothetical protein
MSLKHCIQSVVKGWNHRVVGAALAMVLGVACGGPEDAEGLVQHDSQTQESLAPDDAREVRAAICSYGYWRCPATNVHYGYESLACNHDYQASKPQAQAQCTSECTKTCVDSGWMTY